MGWVGMFGGRERGERKAERHKGGGIEGGKWRTRRGERVEGSWVVGERGRGGKREGTREWTTGMSPTEKTGQTKSASASDYLSETREMRVRVAERGSQ